MKRREFIAATAALLVSLHDSRAQGKCRRLGFLAIGDGSGKALNQAELAFFDALRSLGWIEGKNLVVEYRFSQPADRLPTSVTELIALSPDVLIAPGPQAALALKSVTATVPIIFVGVADPVRLGLVQSLSRPGGNITGFTTNVPDDFLEKRLEILRELVAVPSVQFSRVTLLAIAKASRMLGSISITINLGERGTHGSAERDFSSSICPNDCRKFIGTRGDGPWSPGLGSIDKAEHRLHPGG